MKFNKRNFTAAIIQIFIFFTIVFFVPATSSDKYFKFYYGIDNIINIEFWNMILGLAILISMVKFLSKKIVKLEFIFILSGCLLILWNLFLFFIDSNSNYGYFGFILLTFPAINSLSIVKLNKTIIFSIVFILLAIALTYFSDIFNINVFPIEESRYFKKSIMYGDFGLINSSLYGQSNAAGSVLTFCFLFLLLLISRNQYHYYRVLPLLLFLGIISTSSVGSIVVSSGAATFLIYKSSRKYRPFIFFSFIVIIVFVLNYFQIFSASKGSGLVKYGRILAFFDFGFSNINILFLGFNYLQKSGGIQFYTESSLLDFWLNFGLMGILILLRVFSFGISKSITNKRHFEVMTFFLLFVLMLTQNSSLMPANIVILMVIFILLDKRNLKQTLPGQK